MRRYKRTRLIPIFELSVIKSGWVLLLLRLDGTVPGNVSNPLTPMTPPSVWPALRKIRAPLNIAVITILLLKGSIVRQGSGLVLKEELPV